MIHKLGDDQVKFNLALSLHAANDEKRNTIMPINEQNSLKALAEALKYYYAKTKNPVTYEYIIFDGVNDNLQDAIELAVFASTCLVRLILLNITPYRLPAYINAGEDKVEAFADYLRSQGINTNLRRSRGKDIDAACGQLAIKEKDKTVAVEA
jgi:23S rRNA (adenine2503-C2)-methyltransferase